MIHQYKLGNQNIVLDICSGSVHAVDDVTYDMIAEYEGTLSDNAGDSKDGENSISKDMLFKKLNEKYGTSLDELGEIYDEITELKNGGKLFVEDTYEGMAGELKARTSGVVKALCLHVAHTCNLNCSYCFASQGKFHGERALMSYEVGKQAMDFLVANSGTRHNLEVDFFGGEPLMNFDVVKQVVAYARSIEKQHNKNFRFTLTTNGVLIDDDVIEYANKEMSNVVLSLDGRKEVHDRFRVDYAGNGSWENIVPKFQKLVEARGGKNYYMRGTFTHLNPDFLEDIKVMLDLGFRELSMEPVVCAKDDPMHLTEDDLPVVYEQYEKLAELMLQKDKEGDPFTFYHYMIDLKGGPCIYKRISGCGSGTEYMAVTPWGDLYPCHQFVGEERFKLGDIWQGVTAKETQEDFASCNVYAREECRKCWARLYCAGGCAANAYNFNGDINTTYKHGCELQRKRIECAIMIKAALAEEG